MKKSIFIIVLIWFISGCGTTLAPMQEYTLTTPTPPHNISKIHKSITIAMPRFLRNQNSRHIYYSYNQTKPNSYLNAQYSDMLSKVLYRSVYEYIDSAMVFDNVLDYSSDLGSDLRLKLLVYDISHHIQNNQSYAHMSIKATLIDNQTAKVIKSKRFTYHIKASTINASGYIQALNSANSKFMSDLLRFVSHN
jgi:ABC-type uncharacterized transport system auxiliary subunit